MSRSVSLFVSRSLLLFTFLNYAGTLVEAAEDCTHTIYIMPLFADTTVDSEFENVERFFRECQNRAFEEDVRTQVQILSLVEGKALKTCTVGDHCSELFNSSLEQDGGYGSIKLGLDKPYNMHGVLEEHLTGSCLKYSMLIIPTNLRCIQVAQYPDFWDFINNLDSNLTKFIMEKNLKTYILWINYNYLSPTDNIGCELDYLLKKAGAPLFTTTSDKDGQFLTEGAQTDLCWKSFNEVKKPPLSRDLLIVVVVICSLVLLLGVACIILCVLKVKYRYKILKMDFLFRRQDKQEGDPTSNYYTMGNGLEADKWELSIGELDIDYDNVLGSGAFAYVVQGSLLGQRVGGNSRGVGMFNGNLVAVKIMHSTADELAKQNFLREIELMKSFDPHAHMLNLVGCISDPENPMLVSELCEVGDLRQVLVTHKPHDIFGDSPQCQQADVVCLRAKDLTSFAWQMSDALCYLASHQFVHKDIAARNVLITRALTAKLGDYGLCHSLDPLSALHESPQGKVPLKWTAIEAIKSGTFSEKSDVWSYGVMLFEMYSGASMPYPTLEGDQLIDAITNGTRPEIPEDAPENMRMIMTTCWSADPEQRPTFDEIRTRLSGLLDVCSQAYGYIQFAQQYQAGQDADTAVENEKQNHTLSICNEAEENEYDNAVSCSSEEEGKDEKHDS